MSQPYKFLDFYNFDEAAKFFGRERETEVLLSDVVATRLVLLFARTGSGKTSLINAGARPRLEHELGYRTFYVRVERDPVKSARDALKAARLLPKRVVHKSLSFQLRDTVRRLRKPVVIFFDQFEEFFLYVANPAPAKARQFIRNIGELYRDQASGVHVVFSFREEFFIEMDIFRDEIPTIFHNESNLRLLWLDREQARDAILRPARMARFKIEEGLVERLLADLSEEDRSGTGRVEPARLQIVCDTLWRERAHGWATLELYERLGGVQKILDRRLEEDINEKLSDAQLRLFGRLIPQLANAERGTKYVRGFDELVKELGTDAERLRETVEHLKKLHLLRESTHYGEIYVEWMSDYLAERTQYLSDRVRVISLRRLLARAVHAAERRNEESGRRGRAALSKPPTEEALRDLFMSPADFEELSDGAEVLEDLKPQEIEFLFVAALEHGKHLEVWYEKGQRSPEGRAVIWGVLKDRVVNTKARVEQAENAVRLLATLSTTRAQGLLKRALKQKALATTAISIIAEMKDQWRAVSLLRQALTDKDLTKPAIAALGQVKSPDAVRVLRELLGRPETAEDAASALERLSKGRAGKASALAEKAFARWSQSRRQRQARPRESSGAPMARFRPAPPRESGMSESVWSLLLHRVRDGALVPFLGPDASPQYAAAAAEAARRLARKFGLPVNPAGLQQIAQFMSIRYEPRYAKQQLMHEMLLLTRRAGASGEVYDALSHLPLPVYVTTTYTDEMEDALRHRGKQPATFQPKVVELWDPWQMKKGLRDEEEALLARVAPNYPAVYHLFGHYSQANWVVLTEEDCLNFILHRRERSEPRSIMERMLSGLNLFLGYNPGSWDFRLINQGILERSPRYDRKRMSIIQLSPNFSGADDYLQTGGMPYDKYFDRLGFTVYWGTAEEFCAELLKRSKKFFR